MTVLTWDEIGTRRYENGVDRGVLYLSSGEPVPWNGLVSINTSSDGAKVSPSYFDGVKIANNFQPGDFSGTITAYTYPDEFMECQGLREDTIGAFYDNQPSKLFGLSYRTAIGTDTEGNETGYKIHVLYNLTAIPDAITYQTMTSDVDPIQFSWSITGIPEIFPGFRPTAHIIFDMTKMQPPILGLLEDILYGTETSRPRLPTPAEIADFITLTITNNGDGTWTADATSAILFPVLDAETFMLDNVQIKYIDQDTYEISSQ